ncbi:MAG: HD-GYP domain-containing protein [Oligoflexus sp.]
MNGPEISKILNKYKSMDLKTEQYLTDYLNVKFETLNYLNDLDTLPFSLYFFQGERLYELARPGAVVQEELDDLVAAKTQADDFAAICVKKIDFDQYEALMDQIRRQKIDQLVGQQERLDKDILGLFADLCQASQMLEFSLINTNVMQKITSSTDHIAQKCRHTQRGLHTLCRMIKCDPNLYDHGAAVGLMCGMFANQTLGKNPQDTAKIIRCGLFHDFGKNYISPSTLHKPGLLTSDEFKLVKTHTTSGAEELQKMLLFDNSLKLEAELITVAKEHHEKFNGHGYPDGKAGRLEEKADGIHEYSRIVLIADIFIALLMKQEYREAYSPSRALQIMEEDAERDYDPQLWLRFKEFIENSVEEVEDSTPYVQRSGRFSINELIKKRQGVKNAS